MLRMRRNERQKVRGLCPRAKFRGHLFCGQRKELHDSGQRWRYQFQGETCKIVTRYHFSFSVIEQRACWSLDKAECQRQVKGQQRVCTCLNDLCNCFDESGNTTLNKVCPKPQTSQLKSSSEQRALSPLLSAFMILFSKWA